MHIESGLISDVYIVTTAKADAHNDHARSDRCEFGAVLLLCMEEAGFLPDRTTVQANTYSDESRVSSPSLHLERPRRSHLLEKIGSNRIPTPSFSLTPLAPSRSGQGS